MSGISPANLLQTFGLSIMRSVVVSKTITSARGRSWLTAKQDGYPAFVESIPDYRRRTFPRLKGLDQSWPFKIRTTARIVFQLRMVDGTANSLSIRPR